MSAERGGGSTAGVAAQQAVRIRTLKMSVVSYLGAFGLVAFSGYLGAFPLQVVFEYGVMVALLLGIFYGAFISNINLHFRDPSLTMAQVSTAFLPTLWVMFWTDIFAARVALLMVSALPALYGVLALDTRRLTLLAVWYVGGYAALLVVLWLRSPQLVDFSAEAIVLLAFTMVMLQSATIGGYISGLRQTLRERNAKLRVTMSELDAAVSEIQELASRDSLTGLFNRRHLYTLLQDEVTRCERSRGLLPLSVCMFDIDFFKQVNDTYGHQAGDAILCRVAETVRSSLRRIDSCARFGGEEFLLILPQTVSQGANDLANRLRRDIEALQFPEVADDLRVTISLGVAEYLRGEPIDETIARADAALYAAKAGGRNRVEVS